MKSALAIGVLLALCLASCNTGLQVQNDNWLQKRKHSKGFHLNSSTSTGNPVLATTVTPSGTVHSEPVYEQVIHEVIESPYSASPVVQLVASASVSDPIPVSIVEPATFDIMKPEGRNEDDEDLYFNGMNFVAIMGFVLSILVIAHLFFLPRALSLIVLSIIALIFSIVGIYSTRKGLAITGVVINVLMLGFIAFVAMTWGIGL